MHIILYSTIIYLKMSSIQPTRQNQLTNLSHIMKLNTFMDKREKL